ncbi:MAG: hypothetical protein KDA45_10205 [Planctomycetales bacterium]|nr:hypothetical protein [Planctomycetales bacterium]
MADKADVRSLQQLEHFAEQIQHFRGQLLHELEYLQLELRRLSQWLDSEVRGYWAAESTIAERRMGECRAALSRCLSSVRPDEQRPCTEEKKRFAQARDRRELCQQKMRITLSAMALWEAELNKQHSKVQRCRDLADSQLLVAYHQLQEQIERLRTYAGLRSTAFTDHRPSPAKPADKPEAPDSPGEIP